jgi:hypothetical protein
MEWILRWPMNLNRTVRCSHLASENKGDVGTIVLKVTIKWKQKKGGGKGAKLIASVEGL